MKFLVAVSLSGIFITSCVQLSQHQHIPQKPKNIILMIGDGMGPGAIKALRMLKDNPQTSRMENLLFDRYLVGSVDTNSLDENENITDSAAAATAYATGQKTANRVLSIDRKQQPMLTVLEQSKMQGMSTGLVVTSEVTHATPAAFASHVADREMMVQIADQYFDHQFQHHPMVDIILGGGRKYFTRNDRNLVNEFQTAGYQYVDSRDALISANEPLLLGLFAQEGMPKMFDRDQTMPSLAEMTQAALTRLSTNKQGFFLMVEGSEIDWAAHANDIVGVASEMEDFENAFKTVLDFVKENPETLVILTADHVTGGLSIGSDPDGKEHYIWLPQVIKTFHSTPEKIAKDAMLSGDLAGEFQKATTLKLSESELQRLQNTDITDWESSRLLVASIISLRSHTGWTSEGHTGEDVFLYALGPQSERLVGHKDNTDIGQFIFEILAEKSK